MTHEPRTFCQENARPTRPIDRAARIWAKINSWGLYRLGRLWPTHYFGAPFFGMFAHHTGPGGPLTGHAKAFHQSTAVQGGSASSYFRSSGISTLAEENGGICSFRMGIRIAIYQITNKPIARDDDLAPSTDTNSDLFGDFMGSLHNDHPARPAKRAAVERLFGSAKFVESLEPHIRKHAGDYLTAVARREVPLDEFTLDLVAHVDSFIPGVLDLRQHPLTEFLHSPEYGGVVRDFFTVASNVISNADPGAIKEVDVIVPFVRTLLHENATALAGAPNSNLIRKYFAHWELPFNRASIDRLQTPQLKELGTLIVATYDTTALSLLWALAYLESLPKEKALVVAEARYGKNSAGELSATEQAILEAVRFGGSNPTALWRGTRNAFFLRHNRGGSVSVPRGTMVWLDRRQANQDPRIFPEPHVFSTGNIRTVCATPRETVSSLLSRNRYEINSFSMINAKSNPRKCPGRIFSVKMQAVLLEELYSHYEVLTEGIDLSLMRGSSMPRPAHAGTVLISPRHPSAADEGNFR